MGVMLRKAILWFDVLLLAFLAGMAAQRFDIWPAGFFSPFMDLVAYDKNSGTSVGERLMRELASEPRAVMIDSAMDVPAQSRALTSPAFQTRRAPPVLHLTRERLPGYMLVAGAFDFFDGYYGAVLVSPESEIIHQWTLSERDLPWQGKADANVFLHGMAIQPDGSLFATMDRGTSVQKVDVCSRRIWAREGVFHHALELRQGGLWALMSYQHEQGHTDEALVELDPASGEVRRQITISAIIDANPDTDIFGIRQYDWATQSDWGYDPLHINDIDPLPATLAPAFPMFETGDLLISLRSLNLVAVIDPDTLAIKWWRSGAWRRQHDPDWLDDGRIAVFDNNMHRGPSRIVAIDPADNAVEVLVDGAEIDFTTPIRGKIDVYGVDMLVTSPEQGRVFAVGPDGRLFLDFRNLYDASGKTSLLLSEARFLPLDFFDGPVWEACGQPAGTATTAE